MRINYLFLLLMFFINPYYSICQDSLDYNQLANIMLLENPALAYDKKAFEIALKDLSSARLNILPDLNATVSNSLSNGRSLDQITYQYVQQNFYNNIYRLQSNLNVYQGGKANIIIDKYKLSIEIQKDRIANTTISLHKELFSCYAEASMLKEIEKVWLDKIKRLSQLKEISILRANAGKSTSSAVSTIDIEINRSKQYLNNIIYRHDVILLKIKSLIALSDKGLKIKYLKKNQPDSIFFSQQQIEQIATSLPSVSLSAKRISFSEAEIKLSRTNNYPSLILGGTLGTGYSSILLNNTFINNDWQNQMNNNYFQVASLNLYVPIFNRFQNRIINQKNILLFQQTKDTYKKNFLETIEFLNTQNLQLRNSFENYKIGINSIALSDQIINESTINYKSGRLGAFEFLMILEEKSLLEESTVISKYNYLIARKNLELFESGSIVE